MSRSYGAGCDLASGALGFLAGLVLGGVLAVLYAPQSGRATRDDLARRTAQARTDMRTAINAARSTASRRMSELRHEAGLE